MDDDIRDQPRKLVADLDFNIAGEFFCRRLALIWRRSTKRQGRLTFTASSGSEGFAKVGFPV
jgi:hypothetical protein